MDWNFNLIFLFVLIFGGCGVKSDPIPPAGTAIPSYESQYLQKDQDSTQKSKKSDKKKKDQD